VVAICDVDDRVTAAARKQFPKATFFTDFRKMIAAGAVDFVVNEGELCGLIGRAAEICIRNGLAFRQDQERAIESATEHFRVSVARLNLRRGRAAESEDALRRAITQEQSLRDLVVALVSTPSVRIDSVGVYVLSDRVPPATDKSVNPL